MGLAHVCTLEGIAFMKQLRKLKLQSFHLVLEIDRSPCIMAVRVVKFSNGGYKIRKVFAKKSTCSKEIVEF